MRVTLEGKTERAPSSSSLPICRYTHTHTRIHTPNDPLQGFIFPCLTVVFISTPVALYLDCRSLKNNPNLPEDYATVCLFTFKQLKEPSNRKWDSRNSTSSLPGNGTSWSIHTGGKWPRQDNCGKNYLNICVTFVQIICQLNLLFFFYILINQQDSSNKCWDRKTKLKLPHNKSRYCSVILFNTKIQWVWRLSSWPPHRSHNTELKYTLSRDRRGQIECHCNIITKSIKTPLYTCWPVTSTFPLCCE